MPGARLRRPRGLPGRSADWEHPLTACAERGCGHSVAARLLGEVEVSEAGSKVVTTGGDVRSLPVR